MRCIIKTRTFSYFLVLEIKLHFKIFVILFSSRHQHIFSAFNPHMPYHFINFYSCIVFRVSLYWDQSFMGYIWVISRPLLLQMKL